MLKAVSTALAAGCAYLASVGTAAADPVSIGSFIISAMMSSGLGAIIPTVSAALIGNVVLGAAVIGSMLIQSALMKKPSIQPQEFKNVFRGDNDTSEIRAIGRVRIGGLAAFGNTNGRDRYRLICHTRGLWTATEEHYFGGREITVEDDGAVSSPPYARPGGSWAYVQSKIGAGDETAWPELLSGFPSLWSPEHRVRGIHQSLVKYVSPGMDSQANSEKHMQLYQGGEPAYEKVGRAEPVYDPREVSQSATDPATWEWRENAITNAAHILRSFPSLKAADLDYGHMAGEADKADAVVATKAGSEPRARAWGIWTSESARGDIMEQVLRSIGAEIVQTSDNLYTIRLVDDDPEPEIQIPAKHVLEIEYASGPESVQRPNVCRVKYYCQERNYDFADIDLTGIAWARHQDEIDRVGEQIDAIELPFCPSSRQAQQIGRRLFALGRADAGIMRLNYAGVAAWGRTIAMLPFPDVGTDGAVVWKKCAIGSPRVNDDEGKVDLPFVVWPDLPPWSPAVDEAQAPEPIPDLQYPSALATPAAPAEACQIVYPDASREVRIRFAGVAGGTLAEATRRSYSDGLPTSWASMIEFLPLTFIGGDWYAYASADWEGRDADFRVRFFDANEEGSFWSPRLEVRPLVVNNATPSVPTNVAHVPAGSNPDEVVATAPDDLHVSYMRFEISGASDPGWPVDDLVPCRPGDERSVEIPPITPPAWPGSITIEYSVTACTSDGTPSAAVTGSYTVTSPPPGGS